MNFLIDCGLDTSYFLEFPPRDIIGLKCGSLDNTYHTSSSNDATPSNVPSENDRKRII